MRGLTRASIEKIFSSSFDVMGCRTRACPRSALSCAASREHLACGVKPGNDSSGFMSANAGIVFDRLRETVMPVHRRRILQLGAAAALLASLPHGAKSETYPSCPVRLLV